jgi:hypothetical protein
LFNRCLQQRKKILSIVSNSVKFLSAATDSAKNFQLPSPKVLKNVPKNIILFGLKNIFLNAVGIRGKKF